MARTRNPRVMAVEQMRDIRAALDGAMARWKYGGSRKVYVPQADREPGDNVYMRPRRPEEYPENQAQAWLSLFGAMEEVITHATDVRELARRQYHATLAAQQTEIKTEDGNA